MTDRCKTLTSKWIRPALCALASLSFLLGACSKPPNDPPAVTVFATILASVTPTGTAGPSPTASAVPPTNTPAPTITPPPTPTPIPPKPLTVTLVGEPETLHPLYAATHAAQTILGALYVGCVGQDEHGAPVALGCESVPTLENGGARFVGDGDERHLEVTFHIRAGWRWTDGQPVTAVDALYAWDLIMSPEAQVNDALTQKVFQMSAPDERTIVVNFMSAAQARLAAAGKLHGDVAFEYFSQRGAYDAYEAQATPLADAYYWAVVRWLPAHVLKDIPVTEQLKSAFAEKPVGDGAFELSTWNKGSDLTLTRSTQPFLLEQQGNVPAITFKFVRDDAAAAQLLQSGDAQLSEPIAAGLVSATGMTITPVVAPVMEQIVLNTTRFPFDDVKVRQALRLAVDARAVISDPLTGPATAAQVIDPAGLLNGLDKASLLPAPDPATAQSLLVEAGWQCGTAPCVKPFEDKNGDVVTRTLVFTLVTNERQPRNALSQVIQKQLAQVGFGVDIQIVHGLGKASQLFAPFDQGGILLTRNFDAAMYQAPALSRLSGVFDCASIPTAKAPAPTQGNVFGFCDNTMDPAIATAEQGDISVSSTERAKALGDLLKAITGNALFVPLYSPLMELPSRDVGGLRYAGSGVITWNAWEWQQLSFTDR